MSPNPIDAPFDGTTPAMPYDPTAPVVADPTAPGILVYPATVPTADPTTAPVVAPDPTTPAPTPAPTDSTPAAPTPDATTVADGLQEFEADLVADLREALAKAEQKIHDTIATGVAKIAVLREKVKSDFEEARQALDKV